MGDTIKQSDNNRYLLEVEVESADGELMEFIVTFEFAEVERR